MSDFFVAASAEHIKKEKEKARQLKKTPWWKQKLQKGECFYCGKIFSSDQLTMDHQQPLARGGKTGKNNVVVSCKDCNNKKSYKTVVEVTLNKSKK